MSPDDDLLDWLQLARTPKIGSLQFFRLIEHHGSAQAALRWLGTPTGLAKANIERLHRRADAIDELQALQALGGRLLRHTDTDYPALLRQIPDPPPLLSCLGDTRLFGATSIAVVGARNASGNGCKMATRLASGISTAGITITSGLARGIDTAAHEGGLLGSGSTIAVIASGIDIAYPAENRDLMARIAGQGLVVTERPLGAAPMARHFPRRNRIISGLSKAIVVVEAAEKSGSLMTARLGLEHGREVMAVPGSPMDPRHRGTNRLLRDGAQMVEQVEDVLDNIPEHLRAPMPARQPAPKPRRDRAAGLDVRRAAPPSTSDDALAGRLTALLGPEPLAVDELIRQCHASAGAVQDVLLQLEMDGRISRHPGNRVALEVP